MIEDILGSKSKECVFVFIVERGQGYASEIARFFNIGITPVKKQLEQLEKSFVLVSKDVGTTRMYYMNPRYAFKEELSALIKKAVSFYPKDKYEALVMNRRRPRAKNKPL